MSMLGMQADELRGYALSVRNVALRTTSLCHEARRDLFDSAVRMEQAADTIEKLEPHSNQLEPSRWHALFGTPERAARTLSIMQRCELGIIGNCGECEMHDACSVRDGDYDALLEWLKGDAE